MVLERRGDCSLTLVRVMVGRKREEKKRRRRKRKKEEDNKKKIQVWKFRTPLLFGSLEFMFGNILFMFGTLVWKFCMDLLVRKLPSLFLCLCFVIAQIWGSR